MRSIQLVLAGGLRSWGGSSYGDHRTTEPYPQQSAAVGLLGAMVGIDRNDTSVQNLWYGSWRLVSLSVELTGQLQRLTDFQSVEGSLDMAGKVRHDRKTKKPALVVGYRHYLVERLDVLALLPADNLSEVNLKTVEKAIYSPAFTPFIGRRACPFEAPPWIPDNYYPIRFDGNPNQIVTALEAKAKWALDSMRQQFGANFRKFSTTLVTPRDFFTGVNQGGQANGGVGQVFADQRIGAVPSYGERQVEIYRRTICLEAK